MTPPAPQREAHFLDPDVPRPTALARGLQGPDEARTLPQLCADIVATSVLTNGQSGQNGMSGQDPGGTVADVPTPHPEVLVTVPVVSLIGLTDEPSMLDGHGPIPASMARNLVADGADSFYRVLVDPRDGAPLEIGRSSYRVTKAIRRWLRLRDGKCPFPSCSNHSLDNDADHLLAWHQGGTTGVSNLGQPCPKHHRLKHTSTWTPTPATKNEPPGWISPSGRRYKSEHQEWEPPHWPEGLAYVQGGTLQPWVPEDFPVKDLPPFRDLMYPEPPPEEPPGENLLDADELPPDDPLWEESYAMPFVLPEDPVKDWELLLT